MRDKRPKLRSHASICIGCADIQSRTYYWVRASDCQSRRNIDAGETLGLARKISFEEVCQVYESNGCKLLETTYVNNTTNMKFRCKCSGVGECSFKYFKISKQCKECGKKEIGNKNRLSYESIKTEFASVGCTLLEEDYKNAHTPMKYICVCGHESKITYTHFKSGQRCINCRNNKIAEKLRKYSIEEIKSDFEKEGYTLLEEDYINYTKSMRYICSRGHKNKTSLASFYNNRRCKECWRLDHLGENHPSWKHEITREERLFQRNYPEYREWRTKVFERDNFTCQFCGIKGAKLEAHHLDGYNWCKEKRIDVDNGKTLCEECHNDFHSIHGRGNNTREQFNRWLRNSLKRDAM